MWLETVNDGAHEIVVWVFIAVSGLILILNIVQVSMACCYKSQFRSGSSIDVFISIGGMLLMSSVLMRGVSTRFEVDKEVLCDLFPSILCVGLSEFIGGMMVKSWSLFLFEYFLVNRKAKYEEWKANFWMLIISMICCAGVVVWSVKYTPYFDFTTRECTSEEWYIWKLSTSIYHAALLVCAFIASFACLKVGTAYAILTSLSIINTTACTIAGVVVYYVYDGPDTTDYAISGGLMLWAVLFNCFTGIISRCYTSRNYGPRRDSLEIPIDGDTYDTIVSDKIKVSEYDNISDKPNNEYSDFGIIMD